VIAQGVLEQQAFPIGESKGNQIQSPRCNAPEVMGARDEGNGNTTTPTTPLDIDGDKVGARMLGHGFMSVDELQEIDLGIATTLSRHTSVRNYPNNTRRSWPNYSSTKIDCMGISWHVGPYLLYCGTTTTNPTTISDIQAASNMIQYEVLRGNQGRNYETVCGQFPQEVPIYRMGIKYHFDGDKEWEVDNLHRLSQPN
jgi:hypothetical protein